MAKNHLAASSLFEVLEHLAAEHGAVTAVIEGCQRNDVAASRVKLTYAEVFAAACKLAGPLASRISKSVAECSEKGAGSGTKISERSTSDARLIATKMRRGSDWYCLFWAAVRLQCPLVALSEDLPDDRTQLVRNNEILERHRLSLLVVDAFVGLDKMTIPSVTFAELATESCAAPTIKPDVDATLCLCYTGGTTKASRCAKVTHRMALHEICAYPKVLKLGPQDRVLQQHSLYWAASAYGEIDIALAFGCALVLCEAWDAEALVSAINEHSISLAGLVPSVLAALAPSDVPSLRHVLTWGEALPLSVGKEWAQKTHLVDLLISTECWLSLYADWTEAFAGEAACDGFQSRPWFRTVPNAKVQVRQFDSQGSGGELLIAGPMVCPGYIGGPEGANLFFVREGIQWYCTRDCVEQRKDGFAFVGRADDLIKVGGAWVDVGEIESRLIANEGVREAKVIQKHAFVALHEFSKDAIPLLRRILPAEFALFLVPKLPRRPGTGKVDQKQLQKLVGIGWEGRLLPSQEDCEASQCIAEFAELIRWYLLLLPVALSALYWEQHWIVGIIWRLFCVAYLVLAMLSLDVACLEKIVHYIPFGQQGFSIAMVCALPDARYGALVAGPGVASAIWRKRLFSWPWVCACGFPVWSREAGRWWVRVGCRGALRWYLELWLEPLRARYADARDCTLSRLGLLQLCATCHRNFRRSEGCVDMAIDTNWYCHQCWGHYHRHRECSRCKSWTIRGSEEDGVWFCSLCAPLLGSTGHSDSWAWPKTRHRGRQLVERRVVKVDLLFEGIRETHPDQVPELTPEPGQAKSLEWLVIEQATGWVFSTRADPFSGLDSLRMTKLMAALQREFHLRISRQCFHECHTLGEFLDRLTQLPRKSMDATPQLDDQEFAAWGMMWNSKCQWMLHRRLPLSEQVLREALHVLVQRHVALRAELADAYRLFNATQQALTMLALMRGAGLPNALDSVLTVAFQRAWPRIRAGRGRDPLQVLPQEATLELAQRALWDAPRFQPPFQVTLVPFGTGEALVQLQVTHMLSDGYSWVPLFADLTHIIAQFESSKHVALQCLPSSFAVLEPRLFRSIAGAGGSDLVTFQTISRGHERSGITTVLILEPELVSSIRVASRCLSVSEDVLMLSTLAVVLSRLEQRETLPLALIAPQRDGQAFGEMVGLFADIRNLAIHTAGMNHAGVVLAVHRVVRDRLWCLPPVLTQGDAPLINFEWTDFDERHGFSQQVNLRKGHEQLSNPMKFAVDQESAGRWRIRATFDSSRYTAQTRDQFVELFQESLHRMLHDPLAMVWN